MINTVNTVEKGVHSSFEPALQPQGTMRYSFNGRITSLENGDYAWESVNGNVIKFTLEGTSDEPIGAIETPHELYIFTTNGNGQDRIILVMKDGTTACIILADLNFKKQHKISGYYYQETNRVGSIYWTDNYNKPRWLNVDALQKITRDNFNLDNIRTNYPYYVARGSFKNYLGTTVSINMTQIWFELPGGAVNFNPHDISDDFLMITKPNVNILDFDPAIQFPDNLEFIEKIDGNLPYGNFYLAYRYRTEFGFASRLSPMKGPYSITSGPIDYDKTIHENNRSIQFWYDSELLEPGIASSKGMRFKITGIDLSFDYVDVFIFYGDSLQNLSSGRWVTTIDLKKVPLTTEFDVIDAVGEEISINEYAISPVTIEICRELNFVSNYGLIGNIKEEKEVNCKQKIDNSEIFPILSYFPFDVVHLDSGVFEMSERINGLFPLDGQGSVTYILPDCYYKVKRGKYTTAGTTATINYNGNTITEGEVFKGQSSAGQAIYNWYTGNGAIVVPIVRKGKYLNRLTGKMVFEDFEIPDAETSRGAMQGMMKGYWGKETYRVGILPISLTGKFMHVRWIGDITIPARRPEQSGESVAFYSLNDNGLTSAKDKYGDILDMYKGITGSGTTPNKNSSFWVARIANIVVNVDLTDIIDEISGFCIVRAKRDKTIVSEGILESTIEQRYHSPALGYNEYVSHRIIRLSARSEYTGISSAPGSFWSYFKDVKLKDDLYVYVSPDQIMSEDYQISKSDYFTIERFFHDRYKTTPMSYWLNGEYKSFPNYQWTKLYIEEIYGKSETILKVKNWYNIDENEDIINYKKGSDTIRFVNFASVTIKKAVNPPSGSGGPIPVFEPWQYDICGKGLLLYLKEPFGEHIFTWGRAAFIAEHKKPRSNLYGGTDEISLERTNYFLMGHYQKVDSQFKKRIVKPDGRYVCEGIQPFGGDTHIVPFDQARVITDLYSLEQYKDVNKYSRSLHHGADAFVIPLQSEINIQSRYGKRFSTHGPYMDPAIWYAYPSNSNGVAYSSLSDPGPLEYLLENYNRNPSYDTDLSEITFPGLPANYGNKIPMKADYFENIWNNRLRFTDPKTHGELINTFIRYKPFNYIDIPGRGELVNIRSKKERLFVWMENGLFYIPVNERALTTGDLGAVIQIGKGETLTRVDETDDWYGNQHRFGLVTIPDGYIWFDNLRRAVLFMANDGRAINLSLKNGWNKEFQNMSQYQIGNVVDYTSKIGIVGGYDPKNHIVYISFLDLAPASVGVPEKYISSCVGINTDTLYFTGYYEYAPCFYAKQKNELYTCIGGRNIYTESKLSKLLYGNEFESKVHFIICGELQNSKRFYGHVARGSKDFFDSVSYSTIYNHAKARFENIHIDQVTDENYQFLNDEWRFGTPDVNIARKINTADDLSTRPEGIYMLIEFTVKAQQGRVVRLYQLITNYIKLH